MDVCPTVPPAGEDQQQVHSSDPTFNPDTTLPDSDMVDPASSQENLAPSGETSQEETGTLKP